MIGYTCVGTNDLEKAVHFYGELLSLLNAKPFFKSDRGVGWGVSADKPMFSVMKPFDGQAATVGNGSMVAIAAADPEQVKALLAPVVVNFMVLTLETWMATNWLSFACQLESDFTIRKWQ